MTSDAGIAVITPSYEPDFQACRALNASVLTHFPAGVKHYLLVDQRDLRLFRTLENSRTVVAAVEDVIPRGYHRLAFPKKWWFSSSALVPAKGWLVQQLAKLSIARALSEATLVNVDSDVRFIRPVSPALFTRPDGTTRLYRLPAGVSAGMPHVKWHRNVAKLLGIAPSSRCDDYVGNMISWRRETVLDALAHVEKVTRMPWHVAYTRARLVSEYTLYGLYVDEVVGRTSARAWLDEHPRCHTYWGPEPMPAADVEPFVAALGHDDVAFSIAGYTATDPHIVDRAIALAEARAAATIHPCPPQLAMESATL